MQPIIGDDGGDTVGCERAADKRVDPSLARGPTAAVKEQHDRRRHGRAASVIDIERVTRVITVDDVLFGPDAPLADEAAQNRLPRPC